MGRPHGPGPHGAAKWTGQTGQGRGLIICLLSLCAFIGKVAAAEAALTDIRRDLLLQQARADLALAVSPHPTIGIIRFLRDVATLPIIYCFLSV